jgi:DivIVA domain-containing protein
MSTVEFTSDVVRKTKFRDKMRGYHPEEVDAFLDRTATALDLLQSRLEEVTERAMKAEAALESNSETDESIRRTLTLAQRTAEMAVAEAKDDAEQIRADAASEVERLRSEAEQESRLRAAEAEETRQAAEREAARLVEQAQQDADETQQASDSAIAAAEHASRERIEIAQAEADAALAAQAEAARQELDAVVTSLTAQRDELRGHVEALATYLAGERGRVLEALQSAVESFSSTLTPSPRPAEVTAAFSAPSVSEQSDDGTMVDAPEDDPVALAAVPAAEDDIGFVGDDDPSWLPREGSWKDWPAGGQEADEHPSPVDVWFPESHERAAEAVAPVEGVELVDTAEPAEAANAAPDDSDAQPSSLLFRLEHELRRPEFDGTEERAADKPRKPILGRRRG